MARKSTGSVVEKETRRGTSFGLRFRALGARQFVHVGYSSEGCTREQAEAELRYVLEQVRRGEWRPPWDVEPVAVREVPTFREAATDWFEGRRLEGGRAGTGLSPRSEEALRWQLVHHLLPTFAAKRLDEITVEDVDRWRRAKVREGRIGPPAINKCVATLEAIFEQAIEYGMVERNPARGKRRRLPTVEPLRTFLDRSERIAALLDAAGELDRQARKGAFPYRRALLATMVLGGLRIDEVLSLRWRHVDLARGTLKVPGTKTAAADRTVHLLPLLRDELDALVGRRPARDPDALVFGTATGGKASASNVRRRVLAPAVETANAALASRDLEPLPERLTPHSLRRTFASILCALGESPPWVMAQMGHSSPHLTLSLYAKAMQRRDGENERLRALVNGDVLPAGLGVTNERLRERVEP